ncbi:translocation/assembly module TamB domain-containing protein [Maricaulis parjimensis]|uniref:translocation/assembly module TamB domain-containing protein n=1 Tax=Maricaulis parjimensis TaxID=144023 RepID=UPI001939F7F5|nr:translocation/assembly module TamB domain-containing protein [Maricaulis parjimensis]
MAPRRPLLALARWIGLIGLALILLGVGLRYAASSAPGRWALMNMLDGRVVAGQTLSLEGLSGDPLSSLRLARLTLSDADGVWLDAEEIALDWQAGSLTAGPYQIDRLTAERVHLLRRPVMPERAPSGETGPPQIPALHLGVLAITELELDEGVAGPAARLQIEAGADIGSLREASGRIRIERLDAPGDYLLADLDLRGDRVSGSLDAHAAPDGVLASLARLPGRELDASGQLDGNWTSGSGELSLLADGQSLLQTQLGWTQTGWQAEGRAHVRNWGLLPEDWQDLVEQADFQAQGGREAGFSLSSATARSEGGEVELRPVGGADQASWDVAASIGPRLIGALSRGALAGDRLAWQGRVSRDEAGWHLRGDADAHALAYQDYRLGQAGGPLDMDYSGSVLLIDTQLDLAGMHTGQERLDEVLAEDTHVSLTGQWQGDSRTIDIETALLTSPAGQLTASGLYPLDGTPALTATLDLVDAGLLQDELSGPVQIRLSAASLDAALIELDGQTVRWPDRAGGMLDGLNAEIRLSRAGEGWRFEEIDLASNGLVLDARGLWSANAWTLEGDLAVSGRLPVDRLELDGALATAFNARSDTTGLTLRSVTRTTALSAGSIRLDEPQILLEATRRAGVLDADWAITAQRNGKPVALSGSAGWSPDAWHVDIAEGRLSPFALTGQAQQEAGEITAGLEIELGDRASASLAFSGSQSDLRAGRIAAQFQLHGHDFSGGYIEAAELSLTGPLSGLDIESTVSGELRSPFRFTTTGQLAVAEAGGIDLTLSPQGRWAIHDITSPEPVHLSVGEAGLDLTAALALGAGEIRLHYRDGAAARDLVLSIDALPISALSDIAAMPAASGRLSGGAELAELEALWQGQAWMDVQDLVSAGDEDISPIRIRSDMSLTPERLRVDTSLTGAELETTSWLERAGPTPSLAALLGEEDAALTGQLVTNGDLAAIAPLFLPETVILQRARVEGDVELAGQRGTPEFDGRIAVNGGQVRVTSTNTELRGLRLRARFDGNGFDLVRFEANDGRDGQISGSGQVRLPVEGPRGEASFTFRQLLATHRPDLTVQVSGDAAMTLDGSGLLISGMSVLDQVRAEPALNGAAAIPQLDVREINLPKNRSAQTRSALPVRLDYAVQADRNVYVSSRAFSSEWGVDLRATGPSGKPNLNGMATLVGGSAFVLNRRFTLDEGELRFDGSPGDARVDITASHRRTGFAAEARVTGPVSAPRITLSSEPALPEDEILSRLLFEESVSELGAFEAAQLAAQLSGQNLLNIVGQLRDFAGIDRLDLSTDEDGNIAVTGGRRFGDNVYVEVGSSGASALSQALVEWQLTPELSLLSRISADTNAEVALRWRRDY